MNAQKRLKVLDIYESLFIEKNVQAEECDMKKQCPGVGMFMLAHLYSMIGQMKVFLKEGRIDKYMHQLGFVQGALWVARIYTLDDLMNHNRSDNAKYNPFRSVIQRTLTFFHVSEEEQHGIPHKWGFKVTTDDMEAEKIAYDYMRVFVEKNGGHITSAQIKKDVVEGQALDVGLVEGNKE